MPFAWMLLALMPRPDAADWAGRRVLAVVDAVAWPVLVGASVILLPVTTGLAGDFAIGGCLVASASRTWRAVLRTPQYRFTTWRWGVSVAALLTLGLVLKVAA